MMHVSPGLQLTPPDCKKSPFSLPSPVFRAFRKKEKRQSGKDGCKTLYHVLKFMRHKTRENLRELKCAGGAARHF